MRIEMAPRLEPTLLLPARIHRVGGRPITPEGRAAEAEMVADGICDADPIPFLAILDGVREI
jgi:hypothetical protein